MASIDKHIVSLLQEQDCVIIPGFGGLIAQYVPVRIHPVRHSMTPPYKKIAFNQKLQVNDGALINYVALQEHLSGTDAETRVQLFVEAVNLALSQHQRYTLETIGLFKKENGQAIEFECEEKINLLADSFGLPEVFSKPVQRHRGLAEIKAAVQEKVAERQSMPGEHAKPIPLWRRTLRYAALVPIVLLSASAIYIATLDRGLSLSNLNPVSFLLPSIPSWFNSNSANEQATPDFTPTAEQRQQFVSALTPPSSVANNGVELTAGTVYLTDVFLPKEEIPSELISSTEQTWEAEENGKAVLNNANSESNSVTETRAGTEIAATEAETVVPAPAENGKRFYVIAGGFADPNNAKYLLRKAKKNGLEATIIEPSKGSRLHRVSLADFSDKQQAQEQLRTLSSTYGKTLWVLEY